MYFMVRSRRLNPVMHFFFKTLIEAESCLFAQVINNFQSILFNPTCKVNKNYLS